MCGIGGIFCRSGQVVGYNWECIVNLGVELEKRGMDATGIYMSTADSVIKMPVDAETFFSQLTKIPGFVGDLRASDTVLIHTRLATVGAPSVNKNNQPFELKQLVFAHNGTTDFKLKTEKHEPETDSYCLIKYVAKLAEKYGVKEAIVQMIEDVQVYTDMAFWLYDKYSDTLYLYHDYSRPLYYAKEDDYIVFASEKEMIIDSFLISKQKVKEVTPYELYIIDRDLNIETVDLSYIDYAYRVYEPYKYTYKYYYPTKRKKSFKKGKDREYEYEYGYEKDFWGGW